MACEDAGTPDFSDLPDVVWVRILQYLPLPDRAHLACLCHALSEAFHHPSLWYSQKLVFMGNEHNFDRKRTAILLNDRHVELTKNFGQYFQSLTIKVSGHLRCMSQDLKETLEQVAEKCRLETLTLDIGKMTSNFHTRYGYPPDSNAVEVLTAFVRNAFRMKRLHIRSWPMFKNTIMVKDECNVFKSLTQNAKLTENLETLTLFWFDDSSWTEREPLLLQPEETIATVQPFINLTTLGLRSPMLSSELLEVLASPSRAKLTTLKIAIHYIDPSRKPEFRMPTVPSSVWQALVKRNPAFRVECIVFLNTPNIELSSLLTPEVPLSVFRYMKYARVDPQTITKLYTQYNETLTVFHSFCDSDVMDELLMLLCQQCPNLSEFIYHGDIYADTVSALATIKGQGWKRFEINKRNIKIRTELDDIDEDSVLHRDADGNLVQVALHRFNAAENDTEQAEQMIITVSAALGRPWQPCLVD